MYWDMGQPVPWVIDEDSASLRSCLSTKQCMSQTTFSVIPSPEVPIKCCGTLGIGSAGSAHTRKGMWTANVEWVCLGSPGGRSWSWMSEGLLLMGQRSVFSPAWHSHVCEILS